MYRLTGTMHGWAVRGWTVPKRPLETCLWGSGIWENAARLTMCAWKKWKKLNGAEKKGLVVAGAFNWRERADRSSKPSKPGRNRNSHVVHREIRPKRIVRRRFQKAMICGAAASEGDFHFPGSCLWEEERDLPCHLSYPRDAARSDDCGSPPTSDWSGIWKKIDISRTELPGLIWFSGMCLFLRTGIFLCGEYQYTGNIINDFYANYRAAPAPV